MYGVLWDFFAMVFVVKDNYSAKCRYMHLTVKSMAPKWRNRHLVLPFWCHELS